VTNKGDEELQSLTLSFVTIISSPLFVTFMNSRG
jgi:hypothetical protein